MGHFHSKTFKSAASHLSADQIIQLLDDEDDEMLTTCSEVDEAMLRKVVEGTFTETVRGGDMQNAVTTGRDAALLKAAAAGKGDIIAMLVEKGGHLDTATVFGDTPLLKSAAAGHHGAVAKLIQLGADVDHANMAGSTALIIAASKGHAAVVKELLEGGASVNLGTWWGDTPLINAALHGHTAVVELLLKHGAEVDAQNKNGCTALVMAARGDHCHVIDILLEHGAAVDHKTKFGDTGLLKAAASGHELAVATLLVGGANCNHCNEWGDTALTLAAMRGHDAVLERLLDAGADTKLTNKDGKTAMELAADKGHKRCVTLLQMADRQAMRGSEAMSFLLTYNGGRLHHELTWRLNSLPRAETAAVRHLSSLREVWPLLNDLYGVDSMWHKMKVLDEAINDYKARINSTRSAVEDLAKRRHPLECDEAAMNQIVAAAQDKHLNALHEICRLYKRKKAVLEARATQVSEMQVILSDAILRSRETSRADPEVLSSKESQSRQSSVTSTPARTTPVHTPPYGSPSAVVAVPKADVPDKTAPRPRDATTTGFAPASESRRPPSAGRSPAGSEGGARSALSDQMSASSGVGGPEPTPPKQETGEAPTPGGRPPPAGAAESPLHGSQVDEASFVETVVEAERILRIARLKLAPAMSATEAASVSLIKAINEEFAVLNVVNKHLHKVVERSLSALKQVENQIDADRILADASTTAGFAAQYQAQLDKALKSFGRTAESLAEGAQLSTTESELSHDEYPHRDAMKPSASGASGTSFQHPLAG
uniref:Tkl protein kinase n=3 Tax=Tetraselmis sp. GSL018 TaxID=582737 RepID=A0A061R9P3_9CHLO|eukprot:CAMPEP_0177597390 /NCGR_PEP_ID=MMETSP0419_2-20121207/11681_1 /TAXON_ID=582737 /ORGANISM="Tetraselmis sp., Strain GSL018" /LENGTH=771 /DNA_ID=CAMNT_0019089547 /DNA_START=143 /DNA_END=2458 /DNA_ORIENTATION=+